MIDFSTDSMEAKRQWIDIFKMLKGKKKTSSPRTLHLFKIYFKK